MVRWLDRRSWKRSARAKALAERVQELTAFLGEQLEKLPRNPDFKGTLTHHDSCSALREMKVTGPVRLLIGHCLPNAVFTELSEPEACCGFGGTFAVKQADVSGAMVKDKTDALRATGAARVISQDCGCLMNIGGALEKQQRQLAPRHIAEFLWERTGGDE